MRRLLFAGASALLVALSAGASAQAPACPFLPQFATLGRAIAHAAPADALRRLYAYFANPANENPAACESFEIDRLMALRERELVTLAMAGRPSVHPDAAYHCTRFDPRTTQCDGVVADETGFADGLRQRTPASIAGPFTGRIASALPAARLIGVYRATLGDDFGRRAATKLDARRPIAMTARPGGVLIALFTAPAPFKVRKLVWYF